MEKGGRVLKKFRRVQKSSEEFRNDIKTTNRIYSIFIELYSNVSSFKKS
jgi:hypothetical protein